MKPTSPRPLHLPAKVASLLISLTACASSALAATIVNETFSDGTRSTESVGTPQTSLDWHLLHSAPITTDTVSGGVWSTNFSGSNNAYVAKFNPTTLAVGDTLIISFNYRYGTLVASDAFRTAILNSNGTTPGADTTAFTDGAFSNDTGYLTFAAVGGNTGTGGFTVREYNTTTSNLFGGGSSVVISPDAASGNTTNNTTYQAIITLSYTAANNMSISASFNGVVNTGIDTTPVTTFDQFAMFRTGASGQFDFSNFSVIHTTAIPEPSAYAIGLGLVALAGAATRRRLRK